MSNPTQQWKRYALGTTDEGTDVIVDRVTDAFYRKDSKTDDYVKISDGFGADRITVSQDQIGPVPKRYSFRIEDDGTRIVMDCKTGALYHEQGVNSGEYVKTYNDDPGPEKLTLAPDQMEPFRKTGDNEVLFETETYKFYTVNGVEYQDRKETGKTWQRLEGTEGPHWKEVDPSTIQVINS